MIFSVFIWKVITHIVSRVQIANHIVDLRVAATSQTTAADEYCILRHWNVSAGSLHHLMRR